MQSGIYWRALAVGSVAQFAATHCRMNGLWTHSLQLDRSTYASPQQHYAERKCPEYIAHYRCMRGLCTYYSL